MSHIYAGHELESENPDRIRILYVIEAIANFLEHLVLQKPNLPKRQWTTWLRFIRSTYESSPAIREFIKSRRDWYSEELLSILDECDRSRR
jgi:hypothetical protein